jgi:hypothetical protein
MFVPLLLATSRATQTVWDFCWFFKSMMSLDDDGRVALFIDVGKWGMAHGLSAL